MNEKAIEKQLEKIKKQQEKLKQEQEKLKLLQLEKHAEIGKYFENFCEKNGGTLDDLKAYLTHNENAFRNVFDKYKEQRQNNH